MVDNSSIVITGSKDLTITNDVAATATGHKIDASAFGGKLAVTGSAQNDIIIGSKQADTLGASQGVDTYTLGGGADKVVYTNANQSGVTIATADKILDWSSAAKIDFSDFGVAGGTVVAQGTVQAAVNGASPADFAAALTAAATVIGVDAVGAFQFDGKTYIFANENAAAVAAADDIVIELTGLHTLTADNFIL